MHYPCTSLSRWNGHGDCPRRRRRRVANQSISDGVARFLARTALTSGSPTTTTRHEPGRPSGAVYSACRLPTVAAGASQVVCGGGRGGTAVREPQLLRARTIPSTARTGRARGALPLSRPRTVPVPVPATDKVNVLLTCDARMCEDLLSPRHVITANITVMDRVSRECCRSIVWASRMLVLVGVAKPQ